MDGMAAAAFTAAVVDMATGEATDIAAATVIVAATAVPIEAELLPAPSVAVDTAVGMRVAT